MKIYKNQDPLSPDHLALHLLKCKGCSGCGMGKTLKSHSRRRKQPKVFVSLPDATTFPFGAMVHVDTIAMEPNSEASQAARYSLNVHDEKTSFCMAFPFHKRDTESIVNAMHLVDGQMQLQSLLLLQDESDPSGRWHIIRVRPTGLKPMGARND